MTDQEALQRLIDNNCERAFECLFNRHYTMVFSVSLRTLGDREAAKDTTQAVFLLFLKKAKTLSHESLIGWLHRTALFEAKNVLRKKMKRIQKEMEIGMFDSDHDKESSLSKMWLDVKPLLDASIDLLPKKLRETLILCYLEGKTREEAARIMDCSFEAVNKRLTRGVKLVRDSLKKKGVAVSVTALVVMLETRTVEAAPIMDPIALFKSVKASTCSPSSLLAKKILATSATLCVTASALLCYTLLSQKAPISKEHIASAYSVKKRKTAMRNGCLKTFPGNSFDASKNMPPATNTLHSIEYISKDTSKTASQTIAPPIIKRNFQDKLMKYVLKKDNDDRFNALLDMGLNLSRETYDDVLKRLRGISANKNFPVGTNMLKNNGVLLMEVLKTLMKENPQTLLEWALTIPTNRRGCFPEKNLTSIINSWLAENPEMAKKYLRGLDMTSLDEDKRQKVRDVLDMLDSSSQKMELLLSEEKSPARDEVIRDSIELWSIIAPKEAHEWIDTNLTGREYAEALGNIILAYAKTDRALALSLFEELPSDIRRRVSKNYIETLLDNDPAYAYKMMFQLDLPNSNQQQLDFLGRKVSELSDSDFERLLTLYQEASNEKRKQLSNDFQAALYKRALESYSSLFLDASNSVEELRQSLSVKEALVAVGADCPLKALKINAQSALSKDEKTEIERAILFNWGVSSPQEALSWAKNEDDDDLTDAVLQGWAFSNPEAVVTYYKKKGKEIPDSVMAQILIAWTSTNKEKMLDWIYVKSDGNTEQYLFKYMSILLDSRLLSIDDVVEIVDGINPDQVEDELYVDVYGKLCDTLSLETRWEEAVSIVENVITEYPRCYDLLDVLLNSVFESWNTNDPESALKWLAKTKILSNDLKYALSQLTGARSKGIISIDIGGKIPYIGYPLSGHRKLKLLTPSSIPFLDSCMTTDASARQSIASE